MIIVCADTQLHWFVRFSFGHGGEYGGSSELTFYSRLRNWLTHTVNGTKRITQPQTLVDWVGVRVRVRVSCRVIGLVMLLRCLPSGNVHHELQRRSLIGVPRNMKKTKGNPKKRNLCTTSNSLLYLVPASHRSTLLAAFVQSFLPVTRLSTCYS